MIGRIRSLYVLIVLSILYLDLVFPIYIPYVKILIFTNSLALVTVMPTFRRPKSGIILYIVLLCLLVFSLVFTDTLYDNVARDVANIILITSFIPIFYGAMKTVDQFYLFRTSFFNIIFILGTLVGLLGFYKFYLLTFTGSVPTYFINDDQGVDRFRIGTSLVGDYNYYALGLFFSLSTIPYLYTRQKKKVWYKLLLVSGFLALTINILMSGSRRGILLIVVYLFVLLFVRMKSWVFRRRILTRKGLYGGIVVGLLIGSALVYGVNWVSHNQTAFLESRELGKLWDRIETLNDSDNVTSGRTIRWGKSIDIFRNYNFIQWVIGDGFDYLSSLGRLFGGGEDYPHNFLMSSLLYGGIVTFVSVLMYTGLTLFE